MNGSALSKVCYEKDFEVVVSKDLKPGKYCSDIAKTANMLNMLR